LLPSSREILQIPPELDMIVPTNVPEGKSVPLFDENVEIETFNTKEDARVAAATDMAFQIIRNGKECPQTWSAFNQALSKCDPDLTTVGYMPLIQAPAQDFYTLNTVKPVLKGHL
jgi:hypothetical protein